MRYISVCSGIEAATVAWHPLGWVPAYFSEIEKFPCDLLAWRYPNVPNLGDMTKFKGWPDDDAIDLLVGGTPCQSFSVAGLRAGMADPRGNLALTYLAIADRYKPRWVAWENVPGVLSSDEGRDFGSIIGGMVQLGYGVAYRVLDAQFVRTFGFAGAVPQRRRRVLVVGYLGDWRRAAAVLFDGASLRGDSPPGRRSRQGASVDIAPSLTASGPGVERTGETRGQDPVIAVQPVATTQQAFGGNDTRGPIDVATARNAHGGPVGRLDFESETFVAAPTPFDAPAIAFDSKGSQVQFDDSGAAPTLRSMNNADSHQNGGGQLAVQQGWRVRRLTPRECERLQGFPDDYTQIPRGNKPSADGPRYKALGNSMAVNVMRVLGERIALIDAME